MKSFGYTLLRCHFLFDHFIIKREYTAANGNGGEWSLRRRGRGKNKGSSVVHSGLFSDGGESLLLQSMLRATYTAPKTIHWITLLLQRVNRAEARNPVDPAAIARILQSYVRHKIRNGYFDVLRTRRGFVIQRIVFNYLDYRLAVHRPHEYPNLVYTFQNSLEHFFPQYPTMGKGG